MSQVKSAEPVSELASRVGRLAKEMREERGLSIRKVASEIGISATFLASMEKGLSRPGIENLERLSQFFACPLTYFFGGEEIFPKYRVLRGRTRQVVDSKDGSLSMEFLTDCVHGNSRFEVAVLTMKPEAGFPKPHKHKGEEVLYIISGKVAVLLDGKEIVLGPGESVFLDCRLKHNVRNAGEAEARLLVATSPPNPRLPERR